MKCNAINNLTVSLHDKYTEKRIFIIRVRNYYYSGGSSVGDVLEFFANLKKFHLGSRFRALPWSKIFERILMFIFRFWE